MKKIIEIKKHIKIPVLLATLVLCFSTSLTAYAYTNNLWDDYTVPSTRQKERLLDEADLLSSSEEAKILERLNTLSEKQRCNVTILTVNSHSGSIEAFADDYFDYNGFGADYNDSGVLFVLSMNTREWAISTSGEGINAFTDYGQEKMTDTMLPYLKSGNYYKAFDVYIDTSDNYLNLYHAGTPFDIGDIFVDHSDRNSSFHFLLSIIIGLVTATIPIVAMAANLKTVRKNKNAAGYRTDGIHISVNNDALVRTYVSKTRRESSSGSHYGGSSRSGGSHHSGGSSVHRSSSGHSHGGSHGHF